MKRLQKCCEADTIQKNSRNRKINNYLLFIYSTIYLAIALLPIVVFANNDTSSQYSVGGFVGYNLNNHISDFKRIEDCPSCNPGYSTGSGGGLALGILGEFRYTDSIRFGLGIAFEDISANFSKLENTAIFLNGKNATGTFEHKFDVSLSKIALQPHAKYKFFKDLFVSAGLDIAILIKKDYEQSEKIVNPANEGTFVNEIGSNSGSRTRNEFSGTLKNASTLLFSGTLGLSYELPLNKNKTSVLEPGISYTMGFNNVVSDPFVNTWKANSLKFNLAVKTQLISKPDIIEKFENFKYIDTIKINSNKYITGTLIQGSESTKQEIKEEPNTIIHVTNIFRTDTLYFTKTYALKASIEAVGLDSNNVELSASSCTVEEFVMSKLEPILNYVFFSKNQAELDPKYTKLNKQSAQSFSESALFNSPTLKSYYNILNIIGSRLNKKPNAKLFITGCNDGYSEEKDNIKLSQDRAENVKKYLVETWGINPARLTINGVNLAGKHSTPISEPDKMEENRRVEIVSDDSDILKPLFLSDTARSAIPAIYRFKPTVIAEAGLSEWKLNIKQSGRVAANFIFKGENAIPFDLNLTDAQKLKLDFTQPISYNIEAFDKNNSTVSEADKKLNVKLISVKKKRASKISDKEIDNYSLILFDFDKSEIDTVNSGILNLINQRILPDSKVQITGYTDRTGDDNYNRELSARRAIAVKKLIHANDIEASGVGEDLLIYDNDTPEGRFYCRTVKIRVETKK